jgi:hypothetical protein
MCRRIAWIGLAVMIGGCSRPEPSAARPDAAASNSSPAADPAANVKLPDAVAGEQEKKFNSPEEETAYWQEKIGNEVKRRFEKLDKEKIEKFYEKLPAAEKANVDRIRSWLPHKRIMEMSNVDEVVMTITSNPEQFDVDLALKRLLEYADDSGADRILKNLGVTKPKAIVRFRMDFGQVTPDVQAIVWGITQKVKREGFGSLSTSERALVQSRPGLFPTLYP